MSGSTRLVTSKRLQAFGVLLIEAAGIALLIYERLHGDRQVRGAMSRLWLKAKSL